MVIEGNSPVIDEDSNVKLKYVYSERSLDAPSANAMPVKVWNRRVDHVERHVVGWVRCAQRSIHFRQELWNKKCGMAI